MSVYMYRKIHPAIHLRLAHFVRIIVRPSHINVKNEQKISGQAEDTDWKGSSAEEVTPVRNLL